MRILGVATVAAAVLLGAALEARAQVFGQHIGAEVVPVNGHLFGGYIDASDNLVGLAAQLRLSFYPNVDFGFHGGLGRVSYPRHSDRAVLSLGTDFRFAVAKAGERSSFDMAVGGALGVESGDQHQAISLGPTLVASRAFGTPARGAAPFVGVGLRFSNSEVNDLRSNSLTVPVRGGVEWRVAADVRITAELQSRLGHDLHDAFAFSMGVNLPF